MAWIYLLIAGLMETAWAVGLKYTAGFTKLWPSLWTLAGMAISFYFLSLALKTIPMGTGYAVWTGIGAVGALVAGVLLFKEKTELVRMFFILLIVIGIAGVQMTCGV